MLSPQSAPRHQCLLHGGASPRVLAAMAAVARGRMQQNYRCTFLGSPRLIAELRPFLEAARIDVEQEMARKRLLLLSDQRHLVGEEFDPDRMMARVENAYRQALQDGFEGLWASGEAAWELGPRMNCSKLPEYEQRLESFLRDHPKMSVICQYEVGALSRQAVHHGLLRHPSIFVSEDLSMVNPYFLDADSSKTAAAHPVLLDAAIGRLCEI